MAQTRKLPRLAVITGDIVRSGQLSRAQFERVQKSIRGGSAEIRQHYPDQVPLPLELFRGDSWQLLVADPAHAFRIALYLRAYLRAEADVDTRFAIGVGPVDAMPTTSVASGRGEAFRLSGQLLDQKSSTRMRFAMAEGDSETERGERSIDVIMLILDIIVRDWTSAQARAVCGALLDRTQEKIAETWPGEPITQQAAGQHLARAGWDGVHEALVFYENIMRRGSA